MEVKTIDGELLEQSQKTNGGDLKVGRQMEVREDGEVGDKKWGRYGQ